MEIEMSLCSLILNLQVDNKISAQEELKPTSQTFQLDYSYKFRKSKN